MKLPMDGRDRESILEDLRSTDDEVRRLAVERLTVLPSVEAIRLLVERLGDSSWRVRKAAIDRLAELVESSEKNKLNMEIFYFMRDQQPG